MEEMVVVDRNRRRQVLNMHNLKVVRVRSGVMLESSWVFLFNCIVIFLLAQMYLGPSAEFFTAKDGLQRRHFHRRSLLESHETQVPVTVVKSETFPVTGRFESAIETAVVSLQWNIDRLQRRSNCSADDPECSGRRKRRALAEASSRRWPELKLSHGRVVVAIPLGIIAAAMCSAGGLGGGGLFVPMFNLLLEFDSKTAAGLSTFTIMGGSLAALLINSFLKHPSQEGKPLVDFKVALLQLPTMLLGVSIGVILNVLLPGWMITACLVLVLVFLIYSSLSGAIRRWKRETQLLNQKLHRAPADDLETQQKQIGDTNAAGIQDFNATASSWQWAAAPNCVAFVSGRQNERGVERVSTALALPDKMQPRTLQSELVLERHTHQIPSHFELAHDTVDPELKACHDLLERGFSPQTRECEICDKHGRVPTDCATGLTEESHAKEEWVQPAAETPRALKVDAPVDSCHSVLDNLPAAASSPVAQAEKTDACSCACTLLPTAPLGCLTESMVSSAGVGKQPRVCNSIAAAVGTCCVSETRFKNCQLLIIFLSVWCTFVAIQLMRGSKSGQGIHLKPCGLPYWLLTCTQVPLALAAIYCTHRHLQIPFRNRAAAAKTTESRAEDDGEFVLGPEVGRKLPLMALFAGLMGGMLGIGGGMLLNPMMLALGMDPQVTAATCAFMLFFSSSMSVIQFWLMGSVPLEFAFIAAAICFGSSLVGVILVARLIRKLNRSSIIVFMVSFVMIVSAMVISILGGRSEWRKFKQGEDMGFNPLCS